MRHENIKTVILSVLVVISLVLTWGIWTFQPNFLEGTASTQSTVREKHKIDKASQKMAQTVTPRDMFIHTNGSHYKVNDEELFNELWTDLPQWSVKSKKDISDQYDKVGFKNWLYGRNGSAAKLDLQFNDTLPIDFFQTMFKWSNQSMEYSSFDHIVIPFHQNKANKKIYMVSYSKQLILEVTVESANYRNLMTELYDQKSNMPSYSIYSVGKNKEFLMRNEPFTMKKKEFITETIKTNLFKQTFFNDPSTVREDPNYNRNVLTDGISRLEINSTQRQIQFQRRNMAQNGSYQTGEIIKKSYKYLEDTGSWTDHYQFFNVSDNQQTSFYMFKDGMPVINSTSKPFGSGPLLNLQWANDEILSYKRPNYVLGPNPIKTKNVQVMSGDEVVSLLNRQQQYDVNKIEQIFLCYQMVSSSTNDLVELEPVWSMKMNGKIIPITDDLLEKEEANNGVE